MNDKLRALKLAENIARGAYHSTKSLPLDAPVDEQIANDAAQKTLLTALVKCVQAYEAELKLSMNGEAAA